MVRQYHCVNLHISWLCEVDIHPFQMQKCYYRKLKSNVFIKSKIKAQYPSSIQFHIACTTEIEGEEEKKNRMKFKAKMITNENRIQIELNIDSISLPYFLVENHLFKAFRLRRNEMSMENEVIATLISFCHSHSKYVQRANAIEMLVCDACLTSDIECRL